MNYVKELQRIWDAAPKETQEHEDYVFVLSRSFKGAPNKFHGKDVYIDYNLKPETAYYMLNPYREYPVYKVNEGCGVEFVVLTDKPDCGVMGVTFNKKPNGRL